MGKEIEIQTVDMEEEVEQETVKLILATFEQFSREDQIANEIKKQMDKNNGQSWNVVVGKNFGSNIVTQTKSYLFASLFKDEISVLVWRS